MRQLDCFILTGCLCGALISAPKPAQAQAGTLDPTFGKDGQVIVDLSVFPAAQNGGSFPDGALQDSQGNIVIAFDSVNSNTNCSRSALVRFLPTGNLDATFGQSGVASTNLQGVASITIQTDGKTVAAAPGQTCNGLGPTAVLSRFNRNGTVDNAFGTGGQINFNLAIADQTVMAVSPGSILVQPNGKLVVTAQEQSIEAGCIPKPHMSCPGELTPFVARFNANGSPDTTFGDGGTVSGPTGGLNFGPSGRNTGFALQSDGSLLFPSPNGGLTEVDVNGNVVAPVQIGDIVASASPNDPAILTTGKIVSSGEANQITGRRIEFTECTVSRSDSNSEPDSTFTFTEFFFTGGKVGTSDQSFCQNLALAPNGQILLSGNSQFSNAQDLPVTLSGSFGLARVNADGGLDSTFGDGGIVTSNFFGSGSTFILIQPDGKVVVVGSAVGNTPADSVNGITTLALARYLLQ